MATEEGALAALFVASPATGAPAHEIFATQWKSLAQSVPLNAALWISQHANPEADGGAMKEKSWRKPFPRFFSGKMANERVLARPITAEMEIRSPAAPPAVLPRDPCEI